MHILSKIITAQAKSPTNQAFRGFWQLYQSCSLIGRLDSGVDTIWKAQRALILWAF